MTLPGMEKIIVRADAMGAATHDFAIERDGRTVPGALWYPAHGSPLGLILYGHGGSRHKRDPSVVTFVEAAVARRLAVAAIDGPVHGARYDGPPRSGPEMQMAFRKLWEGDRDDSAMAGMVADWRAALDALLLDPMLRGIKVGYYGLSMGHAFGVPLLAADDRIAAAVIGLWGANYPNSARLAAAAAKVRCPTLTMQMRADEFFTLDGAVELFDALPGDDKRFLLMPGPHALTAEQTETGLSFLAQRLGAGG
jgi:dienelactone hydrolase